MVEALIQSSSPQPILPTGSAVLPSSVYLPQIVVQQQPLPIPIPSFDGKPENWPRFQQVFSDIISKSRDSDAVKLHHLERAISGGSAAKLIDPKTLREGNFAHAWELLLDVYEDERKAVDSHIHGLLSLKRMHKECSKQMRELLNETTRHVEGLRLLKQDLQGVSERFVVVVLSDAFDTETRKQWEATIPHKQIPKYEDTIQFLKERCSLLERCESSHPKSTSTKNISQKITSKLPPAKSFATIAPVSNSSAICEICSASHPNYKCDKFLALTVPQRRVKVRRSDSTILLTAMVDVLDSHGNPHPCRAFLDCGSQPNLVSRSLVEYLEIEQIPTHVEVFGATGKRSVLNKKATLRLHSVKIYQSLRKPVWDFWNVESVELVDAVSKEEQECEQIFRSTTIRNHDGTYTVHLPLKEAVSELQNSRSLALKRFHILEHRFKKNPDLKKAYTDFINEYKLLSHCKQVLESDDLPGKLIHYLPHHAILKPSSSTTRLRVVFDASARATGPSLNDVMMIGPTVQDDLFSIILRFRKHRFAITADISKMYRRIRVNENHSSLQRIFWRDSPDDSLQILELTTVTYGTFSAPFLVTRTLLQLARDEYHRLPLASKAIEEDCYVDDVVSGADTIEKAIKLRCDLTNLFDSGGFPVHKWCASDSTILDTVPEEDREKFLEFESSDINKVIKTLGLLWDPENDIFRFHCDLKPISSIPTKRIVLSEISRLFDPLGLVAPVIVLAKEIMQRLWKDGLGWDDPLENDILQSWLLFRESLSYVNQIKIPRFVGLECIEYFEVHGFADASNRA
ncbi:uncharacterized protein LOC131434146 [Malaya genurostris]|uniref:uncharacterized protein LOC131434146 n=1 Tax=Malaya genurostris TaxID=325434 RepID=UPI0026F3F5F6|nr:uncharacterized protein LOC131434146 [Malaya genurostris]